MCTVASSLYVCADKSTTLDKNRVCNGIVDCPSGDDELNCGKSSLTNICRSGQTLNVCREITRQMPGS